MHGAAFALAAGAASAVLYALVLTMPIVGVVFFLISAGPLYALFLRYECIDVPLISAAAGAVFALMVMVKFLPQGSSLPMFASFNLLLLAPAFVVVRSHKTVGQGFSFSAERHIATLVVILSVVFTSLCVAMAFTDPLHQKAYSAAGEIVKLLHPTLQEKTVENFPLTAMQLTKIFAYFAGFLAPLMLFCAHMLSYFGGHNALKNGLFYGFSSTMQVGLKAFGKGFRVYTSLSFIWVFVLFLWLEGKGAPPAALFYCAIFLGVLALPTLSQGFYALRLSFIKMLAKPIRYSIYMGLVFMLWGAPLLVLGLLFTIGAIDQGIKTFIKNN